MNFSFSYGCFNVSINVVMTEVNVHLLLQRVAV